MTLPDFLSKLDKSPASIDFNETIDAIETNYTFTETEFQNGSVTNGSGENNGSCKIFAFGLLNQLTEQQTLQCFGDYYRKDVLEHPNNDDHQNIRTFMQSGWNGVKFSGEALKPNQP